MAVVSVTYTIEDGKGEQSTVTLYTTDATDLTSLINSVVQTGQLIANIITGSIVKASLCLNVDISALTSNGVATNSDVEEGALFIFDTASGFSKRNRIPTFDESLIVAGTRAVDITNADVIAFQAQISGGASVLDGDGLTVSVTYNDSRGDDITLGADAYESFQSSRSRR